MAPVKNANKIERSGAQIFFILLTIAPMKTERNISKKENKFLKSALQLFERLKRVNL